MVFVTSGPIGIEKESGSLMSSFIPNSITKFIHSCDKLDYQQAWNDFQPFEAWACKVW